MSAPSEDAPSGAAEQKDAWLRLHLAARRLRVSSKIAFAAVLSSAALGSAWASQQTRLWGGVQSESYAEATALRAASSRAHARADARLAIEVGLFSQWLNAQVTNRDELAEAYRRRFPPQFRQRFEAWLALNPLHSASAPSSPFELPQSEAEAVRASELEARSEASFQRAQQATEFGDRFGQVNVIFASTMFIAGMGNQFGGRQLRVALLVLGLLTLSIGFWRLLQLPMLNTP